jgi:DNA-binding SARP family transcriptional activator
MAVHSPPGRAETSRHNDVAALHSRFQLTLLDGFHLEHRGRPVQIPPAGRKLIAFLGVRGTSNRAEVAGSLWPNVPEAKAHASLRTSLWRLRLVTADPLVTGQDILVLGPYVDVDVRAFTSTARRLIAEPADAAAPAAAVLVSVGELLPGWYDDWVLFERERLRQLQLHALEAAAIRLTAAKRFAEAIEVALTAVRLEPLRESATRALIKAHLAEHNVIEAVRQFELFRDTLSSELGVAPTSDLEELVRCPVMY